MSLVTIGLFVGFCVHMNKYIEKGKLKKSLETNIKFYRGEYQLDPYSVAWNRMMVELKTCGINGPIDWVDTPWYKNRKCQLPNVNR